MAEQITLEADFGSRPENVSRRHRKVELRAMAIQERVQQEMVAAMKAKAEVRLGVLRMMKSAFLKYKADNMKEADDQAELQILNTLIKQRKDSAEQFRAGGRAELAQKEDVEIAIIEEFLPAAPSEEEVSAAIEAAIQETGISDPKQMGVVMKAVQAKLAGKRVDGKALSDRVRSRLAS